MKTLILLLIIATINIFPIILGSNKTYPIDTSEDILSEGISDPEYITKER